jgi:hypothetical protein
MDNAAPIRQRILALFLPLAAVLYVAAEAITPKGTDQVVTTTATGYKVLAIAAGHTGQLYVAGSLALLALGAVAVSYAAIATLVRGRGSALATVAALIGGAGAFCGALANVLNLPNLAAAATAHLTRAGAAQFLLTSFNSGFGHAFLYAYIVGQYVAPVLMGVALWRSRSVPRWLAVLFLVGFEVAEQVPSAGPVLVVLFMLPFAAAMALLSARTWQAAARPASHGGLVSGPASPAANAPAAAATGWEHTVPSGAVAHSR